MAEKTNQYEAMFLLGAIGTTEPQAALDMCRNAIERHGGKIMVIKRWDERRLAYEVAGQKRGTYILAYFTAPGGTVAGIERDVNLSEDMLRVLILKADHLNQQEMEAMEPQPIVREERPEGGDRWDRGARPMRPRRDEGPAAPGEPAAAPAVQPAGE